MASYHYGAPHYASASSLSHSGHSHGHHHHHHGRSRRGPRVSSQNAHRQYKAQRSPKEIPEPPAYLDYLRVLEAAKSFEFDDDEIFCPFNLLTEDDLHSIHSSSSSERGSLPSGSPDGSPLQQQVQPTPSLLLSSVPNTYTAAGFTQPQSHHIKLHQPLAQRSRNAIPIVDPSTRSVASPPMSVSPGRQLQQQQQYVHRRW